MLYPYIREARYHEIPQIARLNSLAFWDDDLIGERMHPHRDKYPNDFDLHWIRLLRVHYFDPKWRFIVAICKDAAGKEVIAGCGQWSRMGAGGKRMQYSHFNPQPNVKLDPGKCAQPLMAAAMKLHARIWPNRAADPAEEDVMERVMPLVADSWAGDRAESWYLELLAVHPDYQGKGVGRMIVRWGLDRADEEGVCASVISTTGKEPFYQKCGFHLEDGRVGRGAGNPLAWYAGGRMFWRIPGSAG